MRKINSLRCRTIKKSVFIPFMFLLVISCAKENSKENSVETPPSATSISIFTKETPPGITYHDSTVGGIELGLKFRSAVAGRANGIKFYKTAGNTGTHTAQLYSHDGTLLASQVSLSETDSGWQTVLFKTAIPITANTTYIAAYHSSLGYYTLTINGLKTAITNGPLTALADSTDGINGLFKYTNTPDLPDSGFHSSNYWVDIMEEVSSD